MDKTTKTRDTNVPFQSRVTGTDTDSKTQSVVGGRTAGDFWGLTWFLGQIEDLCVINIPGTITTLFGTLLRRLCWWQIVQNLFDSSQPITHETSASTYKKSPNPQVWRQQGKNLCSRYKHNIKSFKNSTVSNLKSLIFQVCARHDEVWLRQIHSDTTGYHRKTNKHSQCRNSSDRKTEYVHTYFTWHHSMPLFWRSEALGLYVSYESKTTIGE